MRDVNAPCPMSVFRDNFRDVDEVYMYLFYLTLTPIYGRFCSYPSVLEVNK